jgi:hypothetical protein
MSPDNFRHEDVTFQVPTTLPPHAATLVQFSEPPEPPEPPLPELASGLAEPPVPLEPALALPPPEPWASSS